MQGRRKWMHKTLALITVIMLLVMMLPVAAYAAGNGKGNGKGNNFGQARAAQAHEANANRVKGADDPEDLEDPEDPESPEEMEDPEETEDPEEMNEWAMYVHARNDWAKDMGLAPGHANLLDKLLGMGHEMPIETETPVDDRIATLDSFYKVNFMAEAELGVKTFMSKVKGVRTGIVVIPEIS